MEDDGDDDEGNNQAFKDGENLILVEDSIEYAGNVIPVGSPFAKLIANNAVETGSAVEFKMVYILSEVTSSMLMNSQSSLNSIQMMGLIGLVSLLKRRSSLPMMMSLCSIMLKDSTTMLPLVLID